jgi:hypothetical protein
MSSPADGPPRGATTCSIGRTLDSGSAAHAFANLLPGGAALIGPETRLVIATTVVDNYRSTKNGTAASARQITSRHTNLRPYGTFDKLCNGVGNPVEDIALVNVAVGLGAMFETAIACWGIMRHRRVARALVGTHRLIHYPRLGPHARLPSLVGLLH